MPLITESQAPYGLTGSDGKPLYSGYDHVHWYVGNARQAASYFVTRFGFEIVAYRGLETGSALTTSYIVRNGDSVFVFTAPLRSPGIQQTEDSSEEEKLLQEIHHHLSAHGDGVKDIAFRVTDTISIWNHAVDAGAQAVHPPRIHANQDGTKTITATIGTFGDTVHTLIQRSENSTPLLPGYKTVTSQDPINKLLPKFEAIEVDHCVGNQPWNGLDEAVAYYEKTLDFSRYWTVDDDQMCSEFSAMRSIVIASPDESIKMPMNEPAHGKKRSQIEEFVDYYNGAGCQHIALRTNNIVAAVESLRARGVDFLSVPESYYVNLKDRLASKSMVLQEDIEVLRRHHILVDFDEGGYLLQIFAKHVLDRPTVFMEIIQRNCFNGFGAGNFKALFEAFEREQALRGTL